MGSGLPGEDVVAFARRLLVRFGSLDGLLQASVHELSEVHGLGEAKIALLKAAYELTMRHSEDAMRNTAQSMTDVTRVSRYLQQRLGHARSEVFACMYLDTRFRLIAYETPFHGSVNRAYVFPRTLLRRSLELNAAAIILAHNHPSGIAEPSQADISLPRDLCELLAKLDVQVVDHVVIAANQTVSMASRGLLG